jgi:hypothetical protein
MEKRFIPDSQRIPFESGADICHRSSGHDCDI